MMSEQQQQIEHVELSIQEAKDSIEKKQALIRLQNNPDFKLLIMEGYFQKEAARCVHALADPSLQDDTQQKLLTNMITAVGYFRQYLSAVYQFGGIGERTLEGHQQTHAELLAESANG
jgi:hypothetical protein